VPRVPPRWFVRLAWYTHRALYRLTGGRIGLWRARSNRWGTLRLTTTGRRTHQDRSVILGYLVDGPNLITLATRATGRSRPVRPAARRSWRGGRSSTRR
jgi:F420H(2)-dependent quinone reductase